MTALFALVVAQAALSALAFVMAGKRWGVALSSLSVAALWLQFQASVGLPADADARLTQEQWRVIAIAPIAQDTFLVSVAYPGNDIRTYRLVITDSGEKDKFLQTAQKARKGLMMLGQASHARAGQTNDGGMDFEFGEAAEVTPKQPP